LLENKDNKLLYARSQAAQNKVEAIDTFSSWLTDNSDPKVRYEYGKVLEHHELYARALEEYQKALSEIADTSVDPKKYEVRFALARVLIIADGSSSEGITELQGAVEDGYNDITEIEKLIDKAALANRDSIREIISNLRRDTRN